MKEVYQVTSFFQEKENIKAYPVAFEKEDAKLLYSSVEKAEAAIAELVKEFSEESQVVMNFMVSSVILDSWDNGEYLERWYSAEGKFLLEVDHEEGSGTPKFKAGDLVEFFSNHALNLGVIYATPHPDDPGIYLIDELEGEHDHVHEAFISTPRLPLSAPQAEAYQELKADVLARLASNDRNGPKVIKIKS